jgi:hypothetical protein
MALSKMHGLGFLFTMLVIVLIVSPRTLNNMYNNILGRVVLVALLVLFSMNNITLGLLAALCIIIASNMYMFEGFDTSVINSSEVGTGENIDAIQKQIQDKKATTTTTSTETTNMPSTTTSTTTTGSDGVDRQAVTDALKSKQSNTMPVNKSMFSSDEVASAPSTATTTQEAFSNASPY